MNIANDMLTPHKSSFASFHFSLNRKKTRVYDAQQDPADMSREVDPIFMCDRIKEEPNDSYEENGNSEQLTFTEDSAPKEGISGLASDADYNDGTDSSFDDDANIDGVNGGVAEELSSSKMQSSFTFERGQGSEQSQIREDHEKYAENCGSRRIKIGTKNPLSIYFANNNFGLILLSKTG